MASMMRVAISVRRILNSSSISSKSDFVRKPLFGYSSVSPFTSQTEINDPKIDLSNEESKRSLFNRLLYRSRQRGFLELDLVLGKWVEENIHSLDESRIKALIQVLDLENPDLWKWISGQEQPPESIGTNPVLAALRGRVMKNLDTYSAPETRATPGQPWVRGWDDIKKGRDGPITGNQ
ncbi:unnamed protein product [Lupinus luteus]|uniref:Succinate dehydrogenase assembly factor 2, mitochondrial n=1 Tax=Lupinus luteus TaxID=3873 RepID=A0AAV1WBH4_LUPLU